MRLTAAGVTFSYRRGQPIVAGFDADFEPGTMTAITGPSGQGKSTLMYLLGLLLQPDAGQVRIDGQRVDALADRDRSRLRAHTIGFVFQDAALDASRTVLANVLEPALYVGTPRRTAAPRATDLLKQLGVAERADHRPVEISGGQAQRIAVCRALINDPGLVLADEPTGNLDNDNGRVVMATLRRVAADGATVVVVTHDPVTVSACDTTVRL